MIDVSYSIESKSELLKIINSIDDVYSDGIGSKRILYIEFPTDLEINFNKDSYSNKGLAIAELNLINNTNVNEVNNTNYNYQIQYSFKANNVKTSINFKKKILTKVIIEWPINETNIVIKV
ncbi:hypothetical protein KQY27_04920 [Methanobrevibacter sp. TMH8]|uniref:hypothetical protein n=1 Tax=Methanobrevibacter sp. TMH8 TaxID=2848611 RepID=UPI001CCAF03E|nr:hypothetical protein [Methanobrevibacter sp. TMH8]MBZ9570885.1 hypothetical protein [Methanobrevibacter sp. TMH8]